VVAILLHPRHTDFRKVLMSFKCWCLCSSLPVYVKCGMGSECASSTKRGGTIRPNWPSVLNMGAISVGQVSICRGEQPVNNQQSLA
jgi:hypothetical protein